MKKSFIIFCLLFLASPVSAQEVWTGDNSDDWFDPGNWVVAVPDNTDDVFIENGFTAIIGGGGAAQSNGMLMDWGATLQILGASTWDNNGGDFNLGTAGPIVANFFLENGSSASNSDVTTIGLGNGVNSEALIEGNFSTTNMFVGRDGATGNLEVQNGGVVSNTFSAIGYGVDGDGTADIDGIGTRFDNSNDLYVGIFDGVGSLDITGGAEVTSATGSVGDSGGSGIVRIDSAGSSWTNSVDMYVGTAGSGSVQMTTGGALSNVDGYVGHLAGGIGVVGVSGVGSTWTNSNILYVGVDDGDGTLNITGGGEVTAATAFFGNDGGSADILVSGAGSVLTVGSVFGEVLHLGRSGGTATMTVDDGATVNTHTTLIGSFAGATGFLTIDDATWNGAGSMWVGGDPSSPGASGTLDIVNGAQVTVSGVQVGANDANALVTVSDAGTVFDVGVFSLDKGVVSVENGAAVIGDGLLGGVSTFGDSVFTVTGVGSSWTAPGLIEVYSNGFLHVEDGGLITGDIEVYTLGFGAPGGVLTVDTGGAVVGDVTVGDEGILNIDAGSTITGATGTIEGANGLGIVSGVGALWDLTGGTLNINGDAVNGSTMVVENSGSVLAASLTISNGGLTVRDAATNFSVTAISVGDGFFTAEDGVDIVADTIYFGGRSTINGVGTTVSSTLALDVYGIGVDAFLHIESGAVVSTTIGTPSFAFGAAGGSATVEVDGAGSELNYVGDLYVGGDSFFFGDGQGYLDVTNGGAVNAANIWVGVEGTGGATVNGAGSLLAATGDFYVGSSFSDLYSFGGLNTSGFLTLSNGGVASGDNLIFADGDLLLVTPGTVYHGILNIGADPLDAARAPGVLNVAQVLSGEVGDGEINFNHTSNSYDFDPVVDGDIDVNVYAGTTVLTAANTYMGATTVDGGRLIVDGSIVSDTVVNASGLLGGTGTVGNVSSSGIVAPGEIVTPGTLTILGDYFGDAGSELRFNTELGMDASPTDLLVIDGGAATGATIVTVTNTGGVGGYATTDGIRVIQAVNGATIQANMFTLSAPVQVGIYDYALVQGGDDIAEQYDFFLRALNLSSNVPVYAATPELVSGYIRDTLGTVHDRMDLSDEMKMQKLAMARNFSDAGQSLADIAGMEGAWIRAFGGQKTFESGDAANSGYDANFGGVQAGKDIYRADHDDGSRDRAGLYLAQGKISADMTSSAGNNGKASFDATTMGGYWTRFSAKNAYASLSAQYSRIHKFKITPAGGAGISPGGDDIAASIEVGKQIKTVRGFTVEPQAQAIYQHLKIADANDGINQIRFDALDSVTLRGGVRVARAFETDSGLSVQPWSRVNLIHTFTSDSTLTMGTDVFKTPMGGSQAELQIGFSLGRATKRGAGWSLYANGGYSFALTDSPKNAGWNATAGVRVNW